MQLLAYRDPTGRVYILNEAQALPPLGEGYEWTMVVRPDAASMPEPDLEPEPEPAPAPRQAAGVLDVLLPLFTPRPGQSAKERAQELIDAIPDDVRNKVAELVRSLKSPPTLPPFPGM